MVFFIMAYISYNFGTNISYIIYPIFLFNHHYYLRKYIIKILLQINS